MSDDTHELDPAPTIPQGATPVLASTSQPLLQPLDLDEPLASSSILIDEIDIDEGGKTLKPVPNIHQSQERTRAKIALTFTQIFLFLITGAFLLPTTVNLIQPQAITDPTEVSKNLATSIASVLAGPFGFIVGFYFKQRTD